MKSYSKGRGWLFPLVDGPYDGVVMRLGWNREATVEAALAELPTHIDFTGGAVVGQEPTGLRYVPRPALYKSGKNKGQQKVAKADGTDVPAIEYVWEDSVNDGQHDQ